MLTPVQIPIRKYIHPALITLLKLGAFSAGGYPLWLAGGSVTFSDIDLYAPDAYIQTRLRLWLDLCGQRLPRTKHADHYMLWEDRQRFDLIDQGAKDYTWVDTINMADLSPSACALVWEQNAPHLYALYPDDIQARLCRVLETHEWTAFRVKAYQDKGYTVVFPAEN